MHIKGIGFLLIALGLMHVIFPKYFDWKKDLASLSLINRQMMIIHTFFIGLVVILMGLLCANASQDLVSTDLGKKLCLGLSFFWFARLLIQIFGYSSKLWKGKLFETIVHIIFTLFWIYLTVVFYLGYIG